MRNTTLHTICILALGFTASVAQAELDPNMEAGVDCSQASCMFQGNSQASDALRGLSKLPVAKLMKVNEFRDNKAMPVSLSQFPQFAPLGELSREERRADGSIAKTYGSSILVSPCFILTNHHVAFGDDLRPVEGKDYSMTFRAGRGADEGFAGHTEAVPVLWGNMDAAHKNDWAIMKLKSCVGASKDFGWVEASTMTASQLEKNRQPVAAVGYAYSSGRAQLSLGSGTIRGIDSRNGMLKYDGSAMRKQSGGALFTMENGEMKLAALDALELHDRADLNADSFASYTDELANEAQSASEILNRADVKALLDADKQAFGGENPASIRSSRPLPSSKTQMASL